MLTKLNSFTSNEQQIVDRAEFKSLILENIVLISRALRHQLIIPDFKGFTNIIDIIYEESKKVEDGTVASYIPQLAKYRILLMTIKLIHKCSIIGSIRINLVLVYAQLMVKDSQEVKLLKNSHFSLYVNLLYMQLLSMNWEEMLCTSRFLLISSPIHYTYSCLQICGNGTFGKEIQ